MLPKEPFSKESSPRSEAGRPTGPSTGQGSAKGPGKTVTLTTGSEDASWARIVRETVESVAIAFILAFLFRTFEAEAFVIPTGSMAPTLQGRHKDVECPKCAYRYRAGASTETDREGNLVLLPDGRLANPVTSFMCPLCRYRVQYDPYRPHDYPSYNGDRLLVGKFIYDFDPPKRWDVVVFKFPEDAKINYIKRLVGLPGESLQVRFGDIYIGPLGSHAIRTFQIERKPADKIQAMLQEVYDNDYQSRDLISSGFPDRWQAWAAQPSDADWKTSEDRRSFTTTGANPTETWLRYQHFLPGFDDWKRAEAQLPPENPRGRLIDDFYAYNAQISLGVPPDRGPPNWVGDLAVDCYLTPEKAQGVVVLELIRAGRKFQCRLDLAAGTAELSISGEQGYKRTAKNVADFAHPHTVAFANVDAQLMLWIDDQVVDFGESTAYESPLSVRPVDDTPVPGADQATDLSPVGIASLGAAVKIEHLRIRRDVFYTPAKNGGGNGGLNEEVHDLGPDQFFMLGDNSPGSLDSRYWKTVDRKLLTGKALYIYWPHSFDRVNLPGGRSMPFPFFPNFSRMGFVR